MNKALFYGCLYCFLLLFFLAHGSPTLSTFALRWHFNWNKCKCYNFRQLSRASLLPPLHCFRAPLPVIRSVCGNLCVKLNIKPLSPGLLHRRATGDTNTTHVRLLSAYRGFFEWRQEGWGRSGRTERGGETESEPKKSWQGEGGQRDCNELGGGMQAMADAVDVLVEPTDSPFCSAHI